MGNRPGFTKAEQLVVFVGGRSGSDHSCSSHLQRCPVTNACPDGMAGPVRLCRQPPGSQLYEPLPLRGDSAQTLSVEFEQMIGVVFGFGSCAAALKAHS